MTEIEDDDEAYLTIYIVRGGLSSTLLLRLRVEYWGQ